MDFLGIVVGVVLLVLIDNPEAAGQWAAQVECSYRATCVEVSE